MTLAIGALERIGDDTLTAAGKDALARIIATLPDAQSRQAMHSAMRAWFPADMRPPVGIDMDLLRQACWDEFSLVMSYRDLKENRTEREIWPLGLSYGEGTLMLLAHCRLRLDYRVFHVSRIEGLQRGGESFRPRRVGLLRDYVAARRNSWAGPRAGQAMAARRSLSAVFAKSRKTRIFVGRAPRLAWIRCTGRGAGSKSSMRMRSEPSRTASAH